MDKIPSIIIQYCHDKSVLPELLKNAVIKTSKSQWFFKHYLFDDKSVEQFIKEHYSTDVLELFKRNQIPASRCDMARLLLLKHFGGFYIDLSMEIKSSLRRFNNNQLVLLQRDDMALKNKTPIDNAHCTNSIIGVPKNSPFIAAAIETMVERLKSGNFNNDVIQATGPGILNFHLRSENFNQGLKKISFSWARGHLFNYRRVKTFSNSWVDLQKKGILKTND